MENELEQDINLKEYSYSLLGSNDYFKGELILQNDTFICSTIEGNIKMEAPRRLIIEPSGKIIGKITAHVLELYGSVEGEIEASEFITLFPSAKVQGIIKTKNIKIHPGAVIDGDCHTLH